ncbi:MAG TPA: DUF1365 domain-containing protein [Bordetella sp.]|uniref:DUF1365 domain-containing protein n=1 Tax=Bordetella sp. TaxID=28081 RepID=UPI002ED603B6
MNREMPRTGTLHSAVYEGRLAHLRHGPTPHAFDYRIAQLMLDLDEIDEVFRGRWLWSVNRRNLAQWRRSDYFGDGARPLADAIRERVRASAQVDAAGPIRMLTHLRYAGYIFNPVTFYYCYAADGATLQAIVADITNTPWAERHSYVLPVAQAEHRGALMRWQFDKGFHVSPFMAMDRRYDWCFSLPGDDLRVHMRVMNAQACEFDANLSMTRHPLNGRTLARVLWRYPLMTTQVIGAIYWQALRLWLKRNPIYDHKKRDPSEPGVGQ